jgi:hypothetical protein
MSSAASPDIVHDPALSFKPAQTRGGKQTQEKIEETEQCAGFRLVLVMDNLA